MSDRIRSNNNNALDPATMPRAGSVSRRRAARRGAGVPGFLRLREIGQEKTTALYGKFAAVGHDRAAMTAMLTGYDQDRLRAGYERKIDVLLKTIETGFPHLSGVGAMVVPAGSEADAHCLAKAVDALALASGLLSDLMPGARADYFATLQALELTVKTLDAVLAEWRAEPPTTFDKAAFDARVASSLREHLAETFVLALKTEMAECGPSAGGEDDDRSERARRLFTVTVVPAWTVLFETFDPVAANRTLQARWAWHRPERALAGHDAKSMPSKERRERLESAETFAATASEELAKQAQDLEDDDDKKAYLAFMERFFSVYAATRPDAPGDPHKLVETVHSLVRFMMLR